MWFPPTFTWKCRHSSYAQYLNVDQLNVARNRFSASLTSRGPITGQCVERGGRALDRRVIAACCGMRQDSRS